MGCLSYTPFLFYSYGGYLSYCSVWAVHSVPVILSLLSLFLLISAFDSTDTAAIEPILEYILETKLPNLTPKISDLICSFLTRRSSPSSLTTASTVLFLNPVNRLTSPSPSPPLSVRNPRSTPSSLLLPPLLPYHVKRRGIDTALLLPAGTDSARRSLSSPMPGICPAAPNNRNNLCTPRT